MSQREESEDESRKIKIRKRKRRRRRRRKRKRKKDERKRETHGEPKGLGCRGARNWRARRTGTNHPSHRVRHGPDRAEDQGELIVTTTTPTGQPFGDSMFDAVSERAVCVGVLRSDLRIVLRPLQIGEAVNIL